jgi:hypothetical protein
VRANGNALFDTSTLPLLHASLTSSAHESLYEDIHRLDRSIQRVQPQKGCPMINGAHAISMATTPTRATLAKVLGTRTVDVGGGWLILVLPPAEIAVHPGEAGWTD